MRDTNNPIAFLLLSLLLLAGCSTVESTVEKVKDAQMAKDLKKYLNGYESALRWGQPGQAYGFLSPEVAEQNPVPTGLDNIHVSEYDIIGPPVFVTKTQATQTVSISYIFQDRQVQHSLVDNQMWERADEESRQWYRSNPIPEFK